MKQEQYQGPERRQTQLQYQGEDRRKPQPIIDQPAGDANPEQEERTRQQPKKRDDIH